MQRAMQYQYDIERSEKVEAHPGFIIFIAIDWPNK